MSDDGQQQPGNDAPAELSQDQARALGALMLLCLQELGGNGVMVDEDDAPSLFRMARIGSTLVLADFAPDPAKGRMRHVDLYYYVSMSKSGDEPFPLDRRTRLASLQATHLATPPDWTVQLDRPPEEWLGHAMLVMHAAVQPALDRRSPAERRRPGASYNRM